MLKYYLRVNYESNAPQNGKDLLLLQALATAEATGLNAYLQGLGLPPLQLEDVTIPATLLLEADSPEELPTLEQARAIAEAQPGFVRFISWDTFALDPGAKPAPVCC